MMRTNNLLLFIILLSGTCSFAQVYSEKIVGKNNTALKDSLKAAEYPYILPIWGEKVAQKGFDLPYSAGISVNYFWQKSDLIINNLKVGFNNGPQFSLDQVVRFDDAVAEANALTFRPDIWILPFLNIYGIIGKSEASTTISAGIWVPDAENNWTQLTSFTTKANFNAVTAGFGMTPTIGIGGGWLALDMNVAWTDVDALDKPAFTFVFGPRLGKTFKFNKTDSNIAFWAGAFRVKLTSDTRGNLPLSDVIPLDNAQAKIDNGLAKVSENQIAVDNWWAGLSPVEQANPVNKAKYNTANNALETAGNLLNAMDGALSTAESSTVQYSLDKTPKNMWNFLLGGQYQYNKHLMFRAECGFLGTRTQVLAGIQYRFGL